MRVTHLLVATLNPGKLKEIQLFLESLCIPLLSLKVLPDVEPALEEGTTFEANARQKACYYSQFGKGLTIADDSGLIVDALNGEPGVYSARYVSDQATDKERNERILSQMGDIPESQRSARFECCIALAQEGQVLEIYRGTLEGFICREPRGQKGFGYDPIFEVPKLNQTLAELDPQQKLNISHRGQALEKVNIALQDWMLR